MSNKIYRILAWVFGTIFLLAAVGSLFSNILTATLFLLVSALLLPPVTVFIKKKWNYPLSRKARIISSIVLLAISGMVTSSASSQTSPVEGGNVTHTKPVVISSMTSVVSTSSAPVIPQTLEQVITQKIDSTLAPTNNVGLPTVVSVKVDPYNAVELQQYGYASTDKLKGVTIYINGSENLTSNMSRDGLTDCRHRLEMCLLILSCLLRTNMETRKMNLLLYIQ